MSTKDILMDRTFDSACLKAKGETEWADKIITRLKGKHPEYTDYINRLVEFYTDMVTANTSFLTRADYMIENKNKIKLRF